jgi:hypothetical protein
VVFFRTKDIVASSAAALVSDRVIVGTPFPSQHALSQKLQENQKILILKDLPHFHRGSRRQNGLTGVNFAERAPDDCETRACRNVLVPKSRNMR